jgi:aspartyl-tRNA(Asn)/glutamyl-tRNA(Gln) amidotransferase subunit B
MEEDAGKLVHGETAEMAGTSMVDLNRACTPLLEIVSEPDMRSSDEAIAYLKKLHQIVVYLGVCDGNLEEGSFRCDANVSVRPVGQKEFGTRAELKNINSFRFIKQAIEYEVERQIDLIEGGGKVVQETRLFDSNTGMTRSMRGKEEAHDYRYFPDPDLVPLVINEAWIAEMQSTLPELPEAKRTRFVEKLGLSAYDAEVLSAERELADYFDACVIIAKDAKACANWIMGDVMRKLKETETAVSDVPVSPELLAGLIARIADNTISGKIAKTVFEKMWLDARTADQIIEADGLKQVTDSSAIESLIDEVIAAHPAQVAEYLGGKDKLIGFFVGKVMQASQGKANPGMVNQLLKQKLKES